MEKIFKIITPETFKQYAKRVSDGMYNEPSLVIGVIDSVYSISSRYESTINVVNRFVEAIGINRKLEDYTTSDFLDSFGNYTPEQLAYNVFKNRQRTSTKNGVLKSEAVMKIIETLHKNGIETKKDLLNHENINQVEQQIRKVKGQGSGVSFEYIMMHAGDKNRFKPDRHIFTFFEEVLEYGKLSAIELEKKFFNELEIVKIKYPFFTARSLDSLIWEHVKFKHN